MEIDESVLVPGSAEMAAEAVAEVTAAAENLVIRSIPSAGAAEMTVTAAYGGLVAVEMQKFSQRCICSCC